MRSRCLPAPLQLLDRRVLHLPKYSHRYFHLSHLPQITVWQLCPGSKVQALLGEALMEMLGGAQSARRGERLLCSSLGEQLMLQMGKSSH